MARVRILYTHAVADTAVLERGEQRLILTEENILQMLHEDFRDGLRSTLRLMQDARRRAERKSA